MASPDPLQSAAQSFGVEPMQPVDTSGFTPPKLSNSTRRYTDLGQRGVSTYSALAQVDMETAEEIDREEDRKWMAEMTRAEKAHAWNQKAAIEQQARAARDVLKNLVGNEPDFEEVSRRVVAEYPLAVMDPSIKVMLDRATGVATKTATIRDMMADKEQDRLTKAAEDQDKTKSDIAEKYGVDGLTAYKKTINETGSPYEAIAAAVRAGGVKKNKTVLATLGVDDKTIEESAGDDVKTARVMATTATKRDRYKSAKALFDEASDTVASLNRFITSKQGSVTDKDAVDAAKVELAKAEGVRDKQAEILKELGGQTKEEASGEGSSSRVDPVEYMKSMFGNIPETPQK